MAANACLALATVFLATLLGVQASDPDILTDFVAPNGTVNADFFTFRALRKTLQGAPKDVLFKVTKASSIEFPALNGQSASYAVLQYAPGGVNGPHTHPRSAEILLVLQGWLKVGFVDSSNKLFTQFLQAGDVFVFPKGLLHFQANLDPKYPVVAVSAFGSSNAGTIVLSKSLFAGGIDKDVLAKSFKTDTRTIQMLENANMA